VPHLDSRIIDGDRALLFGPCAAFSTKFLKRGSWLDLAESVELDNFLPLVQAGLHNLELTEYLVRQARLSHVERVEALRRLMPTAEIDEWELVEAGQRVQVIKDDEILGGVLEFGTEVVVARDGSIAALLGASPGASTAVSAMLELLERAWPERFASGDWQARLEALFPSWGRSLEEDAGLAERVARQCDQRLGLVAPSGDGGP
jgi:malate dehydrogenase (quinone)